jgi:biopolymer transport protein ExbD
MKFYTRPKRKPIIIVVTMIDVFCVLLIFFIVATTFRRSRPAIQIELPQAKASVAVSQTEPHILSISSDEKLFLDAKELSISELQEALQQLGKQVPQPLVAMQADKKAPFGLIIKVMDSAKLAGFPQLPTYIDRDSPKR